MYNSKDRSIHILTFIIIALSIITSAIGFFYTTEGKSYDFVNQYGDTIKIYGDGLYAHDSLLIALGSRGTDFTILCFVIPIAIIAVVLDIKKNSLKTRLFLISIISVFTYYSASLAFGITYNILHLVYISLFSTSLFALIFSIGRLDTNKISSKIVGSLPYKGIYTFLALTGIALSVAWLPDIINSLVTRRSSSLIAVYTTVVTYVIDIGVVCPVAFICLFQLIKRNAMGYVLLEIILTLSSIIGIMLPVQTVFQLLAGVELPLVSLISQMGIFVVFSLFALFFNIKLFKNIK